MGLADFWLTSSPLITEALLSFGISINKVRVSTISRTECLNLLSSQANAVQYLFLLCEGLDQTKKEVEAAGGQCHSYLVDVSSREAIYTAAKKVKSDVGPVNILINNAGIEIGRAHV